MKTLLSIFVALVIAGCATDPAKPQVVTRVEQLPPVRIPVLVKCVDPAQVPDVPATAMRPTDGLWENEQQLRADLDAFKIYALKADPLLRQCAAEPEPKK